MESSMDLRNLTTFIQVAELGSFTRAGEVLGYSQPTISVQIKQLEDELGARLFDRIGHTVRLTEKGHDLLVYAQRICRLCSEMEQETRADEPHGVIRIATADSICAPLFEHDFALFREKYPNISLKVVTAGTGELFNLLDHNEADIVCTLDSHIYSANYIIAAEEKVGVHFVASSDSPIARAESISVDELIAQPFLLTEKGMSYRRMLDELLAKNSVGIEPIFEMGRADIICELVERGIGVSFLPDYVTEKAVQRGTVKRLQVDGFEVELWKQLLYHRDKWVTPQMQAVIDHFAAVSLCK